MADIVIDNSIWGGADEGPAESGGNRRMMVHVSASNIYMFYKDSTRDFVYRKSTDGGQTWGSAVVIHAFATSDWRGPSVWFDKWTSGDSGTKIRASYLRGATGILTVATLDTATDSLSSVDALTVGTMAFDPENTTQIVKDRGGYISVIYCGYTGAAFFGGMIRSTDDGANYTARTTPWEGDRNDGRWCHLLPANVADTHDLWMLYGDQSANQWSLKTYDDSANSWSEQTIALTSVLNTTRYRQADAAIRHSDGHMIVAICTHVDNVLGDLVILDINGAASITTKTNIITGVDDWAAPVIYINQTNDELFVGWLGDPTGAQTWLTAVQPYFARSTDGGTTWGASTLYGENAAANNRALWTSHSSPGALGRFSLAWFEDTGSDLIYGYANSVPSDPSLWTLRWN